jgi:Dyp-type peroxidase family
MGKMEPVEWEDVQGLLRDGLLGLPYAAYILWRCGPENVPAATEAKAWLKGLADRVIRAGDDDLTNVPFRRPRSLKALRRSLEEGEPGGVGVVNLALTAQGLRKFGVEDPELAQFGSEFREGMAPTPPPGSRPSRRSNLLGDIGNNSPEHWEWGGWNCEIIHGVLLLYADSKASLQALIDEEAASMQGAVDRIRTLDGRIPIDRREHFGFKDGISQPVIEGTRRADHLNRFNPKEARISVVKPGEFVLGYLNERGTRTTFSNAPTARDLGRNGTYLVFRQLAQNVQRFNEFVLDTARRVYDTQQPHQNQLDWVASRLIGRTPKGEPLVPRDADSRPDAGDDSDDDNGGDRNDFLYYFEDRFGLACPMGAHIRRANPRDALDPDPNTALRLSKMHRIIRRGRIYGDRLFAAEGEAAGKPDDPRGLNFICLNADIADQFEMVQHSWLNRTYFVGLHHETDPISHYPDGGTTMTIQHRPANIRVQVPQLVRVRGGAYFFLPGIAALRSLAR